MDENYKRNNQVLDIKPYECSSVMITSHDWNEALGKYMRYTAEYIPDNDPRIMISEELYEDAFDYVMTREKNPLIGSKIKIIAIDFEIEGFYSRYSIPQKRYVHDIVARKV